jgi:hypothetical protein
VRGKEEAGCSGSSTPKAVLCGGATVWRHVLLCMGRAPAHAQYSIAETRDVVDTNERPWRPHVSLHITSSTSRNTLHMDL